MKNKILLYLFIFAALFAIFIYVNDKKILDDQIEKIVSLQKQLDEIEAEKENAKTTGSEDFYDFSLKRNEPAITYFENMGLEAAEIERKVQDVLIDMNKSSEDNKMVPFEGMSGPMRINKVKLLNHKWLIANFTDGEHWGEILLKYYINEDGSIEFEALNSFLYPSE
ncbi:hypothetical protein [Zunongwangia atlantica]|uniref:Hydrolase n=1 Tax=Zunongwangia atlantica 22II14-10F7 TaxID=1185767 RepID=A0A1Y1T1U1_9FLAO|nr:hypothetical protein [Zunongwangia atlantica]ORL44991.1 hypothetical protein IIF7_12790 [Zunongwangia atlantica 22II14-10F7]